MINKTNQFNLNGRRWDESEWLAWCCRPEVRLSLVGYEDRFGPLGNIAVLAGTQDGDVLRVHTWVMSCRAFSRRIEFATLRFVAEHWQCGRFSFDWQRTERNGPAEAALRVLFSEVPRQGPLEITHSELLKRLPPLYLKSSEISETA